MTENNAAQPGLTDDQIEALAKKHIAPHADRLEAIMTNPVPYQQTEQFRRVKALIGDVLSKLRAEGVQAGDEREAFEAAWREVNSPLPMNTRRHDDGRYAIPDIEREWSLWQRRAALASAPIADVPAQHLSADDLADFMDDPSAMSALADSLESIKGNENAELAAVIVRHLANGAAHD